MSDETREIARRVVGRLLGEYASREEFEQRPGGPSDPYRQTTVKMAFKKKDFSGKRGTKPVASAPGPVKKDDEDEDDKPAPKSRFNLKFDECVAGKQAAKAFKKPKAQSGKAVAGKPGKVSYKEALMAHVLEKIAKKKAAGKGAVVAKTPGKVSYKGEAFEEPAAGHPGTPENPGMALETWEDFWGQIQQDVLSNPEDHEYLNTIQYYLQLDGIDQYKGLEGARLAERIARTPKQTWQAFGAQMQHLKNQWEERQAEAAASPDELDAEQEVEPEQEPVTAPSNRYRRDRPPHVESLAEAKIKGVKGKAKKMLGLVAKAPGAVKRGKK